MLQKTKGIVLHTLKYNDTSIIVDMYTELSGRASFLVAVPRSRKAAVKSVLFQPLSFIEFEADYRPNATLYRIKEAKSFYPFLLFPMTRINLQWHFSCQSSSIGQFGRRQRIVLCSLICNIQLFGWMSVGRFCQFSSGVFDETFPLLGLYPNLEDTIQAIILIC